MGSCPTCRKTSGPRPASTDFSRPSPGRYDELHREYQLVSRTPTDATQTDPRKRPPVPAKIIPDRPGESDPEQGSPNRPQESGPATPKRARNALEPKAVCAGAAPAGNPAPATLSRTTSAGSAA